MSRRTAAQVFIAVIAASFVALVVSAQPTGPVGIQRVTHDTTLTGSGTTSNPLGTNLSVTSPVSGTGSAGSPLTSSGDISGVTAGTNLTGGGTSGAVTLNLASTIDIAGASNLDTVIGRNSATGQTAEKNGFIARLTGTYDTTAGALQPAGFNTTVTSTRSAGANQLINTGYYASVSGGQANYDFYGAAGDFYQAGPMHVDGALTFDGSSTVGDTSGDTCTINATTTHVAPTTFQDLRGTVIYPTGTTGTINDWAPTGLSTASTIIDLSTGNTTLNGLTGGTAGRRIELCNTGLFTLTIAHDAAASTAANRFYNANDADWALGAAGMSCASFTYDGTASRWRMTSRTGTTFPSLTVSNGTDISGATTYHGSVAISSTLSALVASFTGSGANNTLTVAKTSTGDTVSDGASSITNSGSFDTTAGVLSSYGINLSNTATRSAGANALTNYGLRVTASGAQTNNALQTDAGDVLLNVTGGSTTINGSTTIGDSASDSITFSNGPTGVNLYAGKHLEWNEEFLTGIYLPTSGVTFPIANGLTAQASASSLFTLDVGTTTRPGIIEFTTGSGGTSQASIRTNIALIDFGSGSWTNEWVVGFPTLSVTAQEYSGLLGFSDVALAVPNVVDGCYFLYDRLPVATAPGTGTITAGADKWQCWCASNSTRTGYTMDGAIVSSESFTTVNAPVAALTLPDTNIYHLKIVMTGTTRAEFYVNGTKSCDINTNIPSGSSRLTGSVAQLVKSNGTTARTMDIDWYRLAVDLTSARSP